MKKVFVTLANKEFLPYVKPLEVCARVVGKLEGISGIMAYFFMFKDNNFDSYINKRIYEN
jgi:hypothetical protein